MREYIVYFPRGYRVNVFDVPENFETQIKMLFQEYTSGTAKDYRDEDKLRFIDAMRKTVHNYPLTPDDAVNNIVKEYMLSYYDDTGELLQEEDIYCNEFMQECFCRGMMNLHDDYGDDHYIYDEVHKLLVRAIKVVINYQDE